MMHRGIGTLMDGKQWGMSDLAMEAIKNPKLVEIARNAHGVSKVVKVFEYMP